MFQKTVITSEEAPLAIGPYSAAIRAGAMIYTSGQLGILPATGELVAGGVAEETRQALCNLRAVLEAAGSALLLAVKTTVYLRDLNDFARMNAVYAEFFPADPPARTALQAAGLPRGAAVEIDCIALTPE